LYQRSAYNSVLYMIKVIVKILLNKYLITTTFSFKGINQQEKKEY